MQVWRAGVGSLSATGSSVCSLWLERASVGGIDSRFSHHNTPSCAYSLTNLVQCERKRGPETAILVSVELLLSLQQLLGQLRERRANCLH